MNDQKFITESVTPEFDIERISYPGQDPKRKMFRSGFEGWLGRFPVLDPTDQSLTDNLAVTQANMTRISLQLKDAAWPFDKMEDGDFERYIIAMEVPTKLDDNSLKEGAEIVVARWGKGHTSPVHGHAPGFLHEEVLKGRMLVHTYRVTDEEHRIVRPFQSLIATDGFMNDGVFLSTYLDPTNERIKRSAFVHNFVALEQSTTLHFLPEHTRDGRDNQFVVEFFEQLKPGDVTRITSQDGMFLQKGEVCLVRSSNVPEYGDHFIIITGHPVKKDHGLRVQEISIQAQNQKELLDTFVDNGLILLKLSSEAAESFRKFHGIGIENGEVVINL